jgi:hypothetical protein
MIDLDEVHLAVLRAHETRDEASAVLALPDDRSWSRTVRELMEAGFLTWKKGRPSKGNDGEIKWTSTYKRHLTAKGRMVLAEKSKPCAPPAGDS